MSFVSYVSIFVLIFKLNSITGEGQFYTSDQGNKFYIESEQKYSWTEALIRCMERNMTLLTPDTLDKSNEINDLVKQTFNKNIKLWMGGIMTRYPKNQYIWLTNGKKFNYTNWESTNPNFVQNEQFCVELGYDMGMTWNDLGCHYQRGFVCEPDKQIIKIQNLLQQQQENNNYKQESEIREKLLKLELENVKKSLKELEEKNFENQQMKLKQDLNDKNEMLEKKLGVKEKHQSNIKDKQPNYIVHFHQDRYVTNELYQN